MIVPMKKVSVLVLDTEREIALHELRHLGLLHIETGTLHGDLEKINRLKEHIGVIQQGMFAIAELKKRSDAQWNADTEKCMTMAVQIAALSEGKKECRTKITALQLELERLKKWGEMDPADFAELAAKGYTLTPCQINADDYGLLREKVNTIFLGREKKNIRFLAVNYGALAEDDPILPYRIPMPAASTADLRRQLEEQENLLLNIDWELSSYLYYMEAMETAVKDLEKELEFQTCSAGMVKEVLDSSLQEEVAVSYLQGYLPTEDVPKLQASAKQHGWGLAIDDPTEEDNVPTKLKNNKFVSLIYPLTDFLGTVPGYFEYDISGWFLGFMLVFFGIIFGDGGYGLLITGVAAAFIVKDKLAKKPVAPLWLLVGLLGLATVVWGLLTCTWFGLTVDQIPQWLQKLSLPVISNVNAERIWYPPWTNGEVGLTTAQNVQILCFLLAVLQLTVAHVKGIVRNRRSLKALGDIGNILQLCGMFYVVLTLVVSGEVFGLNRVIGGFPVGLTAIVLVAVGFALSFVFASYEGSLKDSIMDSVKNIISVLLGVVNVFSDIVSYIRLWAVGLAGAAISATVNEMAGPMFGRLAFLVLAVFLLVFGHGLNMILNVLSVIVHGVRLNTLEFSSHLGMSWSGHKYKPFEE